MAVALYILFLMSGLQGIYSISTVSLLSVQAGSSVSIPCFYDPVYTNYVKYLCKGYTWNYCTYEIKTNQRNSAKYSIFDDKKQRIFTVTINDVTNQADSYWCNVEKNNAADDGVRFQLQVTKGPPGLTVVDQKIEGFIGEKTIINCFYQISGESKWCKFHGPCVSRSTGWIDGSKVTITQGGHKFFTVTLSMLKFQHTGWYYCARGNLQMPVHLTVTQRPTTTSFYSSVGSTQKSSTSGVTSDGSTQKPSTAGETTQSSPVGLLSLIVSLGLLIVIVLVALFIWLILRRRKQTEAQSSVMSAQAEDTATYSNVMSNTRSSGQKSARSDEDVIYSVVAPMKRMRAPKVNTNDPDVIYSTVALSQYN